MFVEQLLKDGRTVGGHRAVSTIDNSTIIHPFVDCFVDQVRVRALIDTMKSFISLFREQLVLMILTQLSQRKRNVAPLRDTM